MGELVLDWGEGSSARPWPQAMGPILGRAQDDLQVLGQGADDCLDVQPRPLQRRLLHGELVALCPNLQGQRWSGAGDLHIWLAEAGQGWEASHQPLPKFQDQIHDLHLGLVLHPDLDVLRGQDEAIRHQGPRPALGLCPPLPALSSSPCSGLAPLCALLQPSAPLTASQMASRCRASSFWAISLCRCRYQPSKWGDLKNRLWGARGSSCGLTLCVEGWARPPAAGAPGPYLLSAHL